LGEEQNSIYELLTFELVVILNTFKNNELQKKKIVAKLSKFCLVAPLKTSSSLQTFSTLSYTLLKKAKLAREISDGKNEIPHKFLSRKI